MLTAAGTVEVGLVGLVVGLVDVFLVVNTVKGDIGGGVGRGVVGPGFLSLFGG